MFVFSSIIQSKNGRLFTLSSWYNITLSLPHAPSVSVLLSLYFCVSIMSLNLYTPLYLFMLVSLSYVCTFMCESLWLLISVSLSLPMSIIMPFNICLSRYLFMFLSPTLSTPICLFWYPFFSISLSVYVGVSLPTYVRLCAHLYGF